MKKIEIKEFAKRVEHVCDFFLSRSEANGSSDRKVLEDLKEDAADIQFKQIEITSGAYIGLDEYIRGINTASEEKIGKES
jgi:hypothetical protein